MKTVTKGKLITGSRSTLVEEKNLLMDWLEEYKGKRSQGFIYLSLFKGSKTYDINIM